MIILITGGAGFIGSNLAEALIAEGHSVRIIDNLATGYKSNIEGIQYKAEFLDGDIRDIEIVMDAVSGVDAVVHLAALPAVVQSIENPLSTFDANIKGTVNLLSACRELNVKRFVYASSAAVYGDVKVMPVTENTPTLPISPYGIDKLSGEYYCRFFHNNYGLESVVIRAFNAFGPRQDSKSYYSSVIPKFISRMLRGERPLIYGDGEQTRDFTYIANIVHAIKLALFGTPKQFGVPINCATAKTVSLNQLVSILNDQLHTDLQPEYLPPVQGDIKHSSADISLAEQILSYQPIVPFETGIKETIEYYRNL